MSNSKNNNNDRKMLENFVVNNEDLEILESLTGRFNIFVAIGVLHQELRHSDFLSFLMDPNGNHGLGDIFLTRFLKKSVHDTNSEVSVIDIDVANLHEAEVHREWRNIDILILEHTTKLVCIIENKIRTSEHSGQLQRYRANVEKTYPQYKKIFLYLTPDGDLPSDKAYLPVSYSIIKEIVDQVNTTFKSKLGPDITTLLRHYSDIIGDHIMDDSDIAILCRKIYHKHKRAIDLIYEHRPDINLNISDFLKEIRADACESHGLISGYTSKRWISFTDKYLTAIKERCKSLGWEKATDLFCEFANFPDSLILAMYVSERGSSVLRSIVWDSVTAHPDVFKGQGNKLNKGPTILYKQPILHPRDFEEPDFDDMCKKIKNIWNVFLSKDLPAIREILPQIEFPEPNEVAN